ncbi:hypothetical protein RXV95_08565 [Novosphingobium sp. ZN18A2]|uniref:hypothetical protein n=1 Tax=Novosphingobium sp. ZN18A2 TaxID=3079861 RepID=UPI0030CDCF40
MAAMYQGDFAAGESPEPAPVELPESQTVKSSRLAGIFSALVSIALLVAVAFQFRDMNFREIMAMIPRHPGFWIVFAGYYLAGPFCEWIIYRRLWHIPFTAMGALLRKLVSNELLLGYLGEAQFYAWVRSRQTLAAAPFGAIKDVTILSALTGNIATIIMLILAWPLVSAGIVGVEMKTAFMSLGIVLVTSFAIFLFRRRLFSLPQGQLWFIATVHSVRILATLGLAALMWHLVLPDVAIGMWLVLATLRLLISRLPLLPNKDIMFAGLAVFLMGHDVEITSLLAMMALVLLVTHLVVGTTLALVDLAETGRNK